MHFYSNNICINGSKFILGMDTVSEVCRALIGIHNILSGSFSVLMHSSAAGGFWIYACTLLVYALDAILGDCRHSCRLILLSGRGCKKFRARFARYPFGTPLLLFLDTRLVRSGSRFCNDFTIGVKSYMRVTNVTLDIPSIRHQLLHHSVTIAHRMTFSRLIKFQVYFVCTHVFSNSMHHLLLCMLILVFIYIMQPLVIP